MATDEITPEAAPPEPAVAPEAAPPEPEVVPASPAPEPEQPEPAAADLLADPLVRAELERRTAAQQAAFAVKLAEERKAAEAAAIAKLEAAAKKEAELAAMPEQDRLRAQLADAEKARADEAAAKLKLEAENAEAEARLKFLRALGSSDHQLVADADFEALAYQRARAMAGDNTDFASVIPSLAAAHPHLFRKSAASTTTTAGSSAPRGTTATPTPPATTGPRDAFDMPRDEWIRRKRGLGFYH